MPRPVIIIKLTGCQRLTFCYFAAETFAGITISQKHKNLRGDLMNDTFPVIDGHTKLTGFSEAPFPTVSLL